MAGKYATRSKRDWFAPYFVVYGAWAAAVFTFLIVWLLTPDTTPEGHCAGLGFGCVPTRKDSLALIGLLVGVPVTVGWWLIGAIITPLINLISVRWLWRGLMSLLVCIGFSPFCYPLAVYLYGEFAGGAWG